MDRLSVENNISDLINQKNYPCIAAIQALHRNEVMFDVYEDFGSGKSARALAQKLIAFKNEQRASDIAYLTYMAVFPKDTSQNEEEFERGLWNELSAMWAHADLAGNWDPNFSDDPEDNKFCVSLDGAAFFVVGLHPESSRISRRLPYNALVFNLYSQFSSLMEKGTYDAMVKLNRTRDLRFQGSVNPMAEKHNENWEAIQFSGKENSDNWKCPFSRLFGRAKK